MLDFKPSWSAVLLVIISLWPNYCCCFSMLMSVRVNTHSARVMKRMGSMRHLVASSRKGFGQPKGYFDNNILQYKPQTGWLSGAAFDYSKPFTVLGIETSCDDTCAAVVRSDGAVLSNVVLSQYPLHQRFGGVVPGVAMAAHQDNIDKVVYQAISEAGLSGVNQVDAVGVTRGPGLEICLRIGCRTAQVLSSF